MVLAQPTTVWGPASSSTVGLDPAVKVGASLTELTVSEKLVLVLIWPSLTVTVMVAVPN